MATFFRVAINLFCLFMLSRLWCCRFVYLFDNLCHRSLDFSEVKDVFGGIGEEDVDSGCFHCFFLKSPALSDSSFEQIPFYRPLEEFLRNRHHYSVGFQSVVSQVAETESRNVAMLALVEQSGYSGLTANPFLFGEGMADLAVHTNYSLIGIVQELLQQTEFLLSGLKSRCSVRPRSWLSRWTFRKR